MLELLTFPPGGKGSPSSLTFPCPLNTASIPALVTLFPIVPPSPFSCRYLPSSAALSCFFHYLSFHLCSSAFICGSNAVPFLRPPLPAFSCCRSVHSRPADAAKAALAELASFAVPTPFLLLLLLSCPCRHPSSASPRLCARQAVSPFHALALPSPFSLNVWLLSMLHAVAVSSIRVHSRSFAVPALSLLAVPFRLRWFPLNGIPVPFVLRDTETPRRSDVGQAPFSILPGGISGRCRG